MLKFNEDKINEKKQELIEFKGWLPFAFYNYGVSILKRNDYLESIGLKDKNQKMNFKYRSMLKDSVNPEELMDKFILQFVIENPQFQDLIIQE